MDTFVDTHCDEGGQWVVLFFGTLLNCAAPILNSLLFSNPMGTRLKPGHVPDKPYWNRKFLEFLHTLFVDGLRLKYPDADCVMASPDLWYMILPTAAICPCWVNIHITESDTTQQLDFRIATHGQNTTELFNLFWTADAPALHCFRNRIFEFVDWRNFSEFVEEQMRAVDTIIKAMK